jgi:crotonobetaine/carnitine-CoA ligase
LKAGLAQVDCVRLPDPTYVLAPGAAVELRELLDWCTPRMPYFAVPRFLAMATGGLAKTPTGKLQKAPLREAGITATTWDRVSIGYMVRR